MKNILSRIFKKKPKYEGARIDTRTAEEKAKDWQARELFAFGLPTFRTVQENQWKKYQVRNQDGSGSCVANSQAKFAEVMHFLKKGEAVKFSHAPVYQRRSNKPAAGMGYPDAPKLQVDIGTCRETEMPSENKTDAQLDAMVIPINYESMNDDARPHAYVTVPMTFNDVAYYVEQHGACIIWIVSDYANWNKDIPTVGGKANGEVRHSICVVDAVTLSGKKYLVIEDSWGTFGKYNGQRLITAEFFADAVFHAYALTDLTYNEQNTTFLPFKETMRYGQRSSEVQRLQAFLQARGTFPANVQTTGTYGNVTAQAVLAYQIQKKVDTVAALNTLKGRIVGPKTLAAINANL